MNLFIVAFLYLGTAIGIIKITMSAASAITKVMIQNILGTHTQDSATFLGSGNDNKAKPSEAPKYDPNEMAAKQGNGMPKSENGYTGENFEANKIRTDGVVMSGIPTEASANYGSGTNIGASAVVGLVNVVGFLNQGGQEVRNYGQQIITGPMRMMGNSIFNRIKGKRFKLAQYGNGFNVNLKPGNGARLNQYGSSVNTLNSPKDATLNANVSSINNLNGADNTSVNVLGSGVNNIVIPKKSLNSLLNASDSNNRAKVTHGELAQNGNNLGKNLDNNEVRLNLNAQRTHEVNGRKREIGLPELPKITYELKGPFIVYPAKDGVFDINRLSPRFLHERRFSGAYMPSFGAGFNMREYARMVEFRRALSRSIMNESIKAMSNAEKSNAETSNTETELPNASNIQEARAMAREDVRQMLSDVEFRETMTTMLNKYPNLSPADLANLIMKASRKTRRHRTPPVLPNYNNQETINNNGEQQLPDKGVRTVEVQKEQNEQEKDAQNSLTEEEARDRAKKNVANSIPRLVDKNEKLVEAATILSLNRKDVLDVNDKATINGAVKSVAETYKLTKVEETKIRKELTNGAIDAKLMNQGKVIQEAIQKDPDGTKQILGDELFEQVKKMLEKLNKKRRNRTENRTNPLNNPLTNTMQGANGNGKPTGSNDESLDGNTPVNTYIGIRMAEIDKIIADIRGKERADSNKSEVKGSNNV